MSIERKQILYLKIDMKTATKFSQAATCEQGVCVEEPKCITIYLSK